MRARVRERAVNVCREAYPPVERGADESVELSAHPTSKSPLGTNPSYRDERLPPSTGELSVGHPTHYPLPFARRLSLPRLPLQPSACSPRNARHRRKPNETGNVLCRGNGVLSLLSPSPVSLSPLLLGCWFLAEEGSLMAILFDWVSWPRFSGKLLVSCSEGYARGLFDG